MRIPQRILAYAEVVVDPDGVAHRLGHYLVQVGGQQKWNDALGEFRTEPVMTGRYRPHCADDPAPGEEPPLWRAYSAGWANRFVTEACPTCWPRDAALAAEQE